MIDLRSDTLTVPSIEMRQAIAAAPVGDDVYGEDPSVNALQEQIADYFGKEASLFVPSGTMSNQLSLKVLTNPGDEVIADSEAHIYYYETAAPAILSSLQIRPIKSEYGSPDIEDIKQAVRPNVYYYPKTAVISLENTHNRHGGTTIDIDYIKLLRQFANESNLSLHLDGARIWNAIVATKVSGKEYAKYFDTLSVCLSKGLGAPIGSLIVSTKENIEKALKWRKIFGGGMRQVGLIAAAGIYAINNNFDKIESDHYNAQYFARQISEIGGISLDMKRVQTNIVRFEVNGKQSPLNFLQACKAKGLLMNHVGGNAIRAVFHLNISEQAARQSVEIIKSVSI